MLMGHVHLATLPTSKPWREVVRLLEERAAATQVVAASALAAEKDLAAVASDPILASAVRLLALVPHAARSGDFADELRRIGLAVPDRPLLGDLTVAVAAALSGTRVTASRTDFNEIVRRALVGTLSRQVGDALPGLFEADADDVQHAAGRLARPEAFAVVSRAFFGRLVTDTLGYWLDRTLSAEVGPGARIGSLGERDAFDRAMERYCTEATGIIREFSAAWYGKTLLREGTIPRESAAAFAVVALRKIGEELRRRFDRA